MWIAHSEQILTRPAAHQARWSAPASCGQRGKCTSSLPIAIRKRTTRHFATSASSVLGRLRCTRECTRRRFSGQPDRAGFVFIGPLHVPFLLVAKTVGHRPSIARRIFAAPARRRQNGARAQPSAERSTAGIRRYTSKTIRYATQEVDSSWLSSERAYRFAGLGAPFRPLFCPFRLNCSGLRNPSNSTTPIPKAVAEASQRKTIPDKHRKYREENASCQSFVQLGPPMALLYFFSINLHVFPTFSFSLLVPLSFVCLSTAYFLPPFHLPCSLPPLSLTRPLSLFLLCPSPSFHSLPSHPLSPSCPTVTIFFS